MTDNRKRNRKDRRDAWYVNSADSFHVIMPFVMPTRCANEAVMSYTFDISALDSFVKAKNEQNPDFKYTWFHVICAALAKTVILRPKLNYFVSGYRLYERKDIEIAFVAKRQFADGSEEAMARFVVDKEGGSIVEQVHSYVAGFVTRIRTKLSDRVGITKKFDFYQVLPRPVFRFFVWILRCLEYFGHYPDSLKNGDPCYSTICISNLGSIKMSANYHHVFEWGTNSFFIVMNEKKMTPIFKEDGTFEFRPTIELCFTIDERIADGFYFAKSIKYLDYLIQHPELLEEDAAKPIDVEF